MGSTLTQQNIDKINKRMCPLASDVDMGNRINSKWLDTSSNPPSASTAEVGTFYRNLSVPKLWICTDASTMTEVGLS